MQSLVWLILVPFAGAFLLFAFGAGLLSVAALSQWRSLTVGQRSRLVVKLIGLAFFITPLLVMVAFFVLSAAYGGSADGGKIADGRYFLANHGVYVEVSRATWTWMSWHETIAFRIGGPICALGIAIMTMMAWLERKRPNCSVEELVAVEPQPESKATNRRRAGPPQSRSYWILVSLAALFLMFVTDAAAMVTFVANAGNLYRCFGLLLILWLVSAACWILGGFPWLGDKSILRLMLRAVGELGATLWMAGPVIVFLFVSAATWRQDLMLAAILGAVSLLVVGGQFIFAAETVVLIAATWTACFSKQESE